MPILANVERFIATPLKLLCFGLNAQNQRPASAGLSCIALLGINWDNLRL